MHASPTKPVVRAAPSPTGNLHVGTARTVLFNFLFAQKEGGIFIVRSEDTDKARSTKAFEKNILEGLSWLGLSYDKFERQSEHLETHCSHLERLVNEDKAYVSREPKKDDPTREVEVIRLRNAGKSITFEDVVRGSVTFDTTELGDFIIARNITDPLYHFAVVVDDARDGVTHVIRGEDHISNTPRQILIQEALGFERPHYAHIPLLLAPNRSKLSKRHGAVSIDEYRALGYLPEAIVNYLALLGWNPGTEQEIFSLQELVTHFSLERVQQGGAVFSMDKLNWFNAEHIRRLDDRSFEDQLVKWIPPHVKKLTGFNAERLHAVTPLIKERIIRLNDIRELGEKGEWDYFFAAPRYAAADLIWKDSDPSATQVHLETIREALETMDEKSFGAVAVKAALWDYATDEGRGAVLWPFRLALSGKKQSPDPFSLAAVFGKIETLNRVQYALHKLTKEA